MSPPQKIFGARDANSPSARLKQLRMSSNRKRTTIGSPAMAKEIAVTDSRPEAQINYGKIVDFFADKRWDSLHERRLASLAFICGANQQGFQIKDLGAIQAILARTLELLDAEDGAHYLEPACNLVRLCSLPFQKLKSTDDAGSGAVITPLLTVISSVLVSTAASSLKIEAAQALAYIASGYGQRHLESDLPPESEQSTLRKSLVNPLAIPLSQTAKSSTSLGLSSKKPLSPTSNGSLKSGATWSKVICRNQTLLGESGSVEAAVRSFGRSIRAGEGEVADAVADALLEMSFSTQNAERMNAAGVLEPISHVLQTVDIGTELLATTVDLLWNVLEKCPGAREHQKPPEPESVAEATGRKHSTDEDEEEEEWSNGELEGEQAVSESGADSGEVEGGVGNWQDGIRTLDSQAEVSGKSREEEEMAGGSMSGTIENGGGAASRDAGDGLAATTSGDMEAKEDNVRTAEDNDRTAEDDNRTAEDNKRTAEDNFQKAEDEPTRKEGGAPLDEIDGTEAPSVEGTSPEMPDPEASALDSETRLRTSAFEEDASSSDQTEADAAAGANSHQPPEDRPKEPFTTDALVASLAGLMKRYLAHGYKKSDRELVNELLIVAGFLTGDSANLRSFMETGLLDSLLLISCTPELSGTGNSMGIPQILDGEALESKNLAWPLVTACCQDEACREAVTQSGFILTLLMYLHEGQEGLPKWTASQVHELQKQACSCLSSVLVPLLPDRVAESKGPEVLLQFLVATSDDVMKGLAARVLLACCGDSAMGATLFGAGAIGVALDVFRTRGSPASLRQSALQIVSSLCKGSDVAQREFRKEGGIQALQAELLYYIVSGGQASELMLLTALECVWSCIALNRKNLARFLVLDGLALLLQLLEGSARGIWSGLLSCIADMMENPKAHPFFHEWRSSGSGESGAHVITAIWEQAQTSKQSSSPSEDSKGEAFAGASALKDVIYGLFSNLGFSAFPYLSHADKAKLVAIEQHIKFKEGQTWAEIEQSLATEGVVPIEEDQEMLARRKAEIQAAAQLVIEEREKAAQLASQEVAAKEAAFYAGLTRQRQEEAAAKRKKGTGTMTMRERQLAKVQKEQMLERSVHSTEFAFANADNPSDAPGTLATEKDAAETNESKDARES